MRLDTAQADARAANNFDVLRLFAAGCVLFSHSFALTQTHEPGFARTRLDGGSLGVLVFFAISGFLVTRSWSDDPRLPAFAAKRALRLMPALIVSLLLVTLVLGPLVTSLSFSRYVQDPATVDYVVDNATMKTNYTLPGVFEDVPNHYPGIVNGSLWTLPLEVKAYVLVAALGLLGLLAGRFRRWAFVAVALLLGGLLIADVRNVVPGGSHIVALTADLRMHAAVVHQAFLGSYDALVRYLAAFATGAALFALAPRIELRWSIAAALVAAWAMSVAIGGVATTVSAAWIVPYLVLVVAYRTTHLFRLPARAGDYSYGVYIYAFPVQQTIALVLAPASGWLMLSLAAPLTLGFAMLSWHFLEAPALRLKPRRAARATTTA